MQIAIKDLPINIKLMGKIVSKLLKMNVLPTNSGNSNFNLLLDQNRLNSLNQKVSSNSSQWQSFKSRLDNNLLTVFDGGYQGSDLTWIADFALGYVLLKNSDQNTAYNYADKAISLIKSCLNDYQKGGYNSKQFLIRGDGLTTSFDISNINPNLQSLKVYLAPIYTQSVVHNSLSSQDILDYYTKILKVSNTSDGQFDYIENIDWKRNPELGNNLIDWSNSTNQPLEKSTYYITGFSFYNTGSPVNVTLNGNQINFSTAPSKDVAIIISCIYGNRSQDWSTLSYQQTSAGNGGFNSIFIDTSYTSRYLGLYLSIGFDWLYNYPGLNSELKQDITNMLIKWIDWLEINGYNYKSPVSNYGAGSYISNLSSILAIQNRNLNDKIYLDKIKNYRDSYLIPNLTNSRNSLNGGFWAEGWNYGDLAIKNLLLGALLLENFDNTNILEEQNWSNDVLKQLIYESTSENSIYDSGDGYSYPQSFPSKSLLTILSNLINDNNIKEYANYLIKNYPQIIEYNYVDLIFRNEGGSTSYWNSLSLYSYCSGTNLTTVRSDWSNNCNWASIQCGNLLWCDHQSLCPGQIQINKGKDNLLINANHAGNNQDPFSKTRYGNTIVIDDGGSGYQNYPFNVGFWYGSPGVFAKSYQSNIEFTYFYGDYKAAYSLNTALGQGGPLNELTRQFLFIQPDILLTYDKINTKQPQFSKHLRHHFLNSPTLNNSSFTEIVNNSKLIGNIFSRQNISTSLSGIQVGNANVFQLITKNIDNLSEVRYLTQFQISENSGVNYFPNYFKSNDDKADCILVNGNMIAFNYSGLIESSLSYTFENVGQIKHFITELSSSGNFLVNQNDLELGVFNIENNNLLSFNSLGSGIQTFDIIKL